MSILEDEFKAINHASRIIPFRRFANKAFHKRTNRLYAAGKAKIASSFELKILRVILDKSGHMNGPSTVGWDPGKPGAIGYSSPENRSHADCRAIPRAVPICAQVPPSAR